MSSILKTDKILDSQGNVVADANSIGWALGENFSWTDHSHLNQIIQTKIEVIDVDVKITTKKDQSAGTPVAGIPDELFRTSTGLITLSNVDNYVLIHITFVPVINALNVSGSTSGASGRFFVTEGAQVQEIYRLEQDTISNTVYTDAGSNSSSQHSPGIPIGFVDVPANKETTHRYPPLTISLLDKGSLSLTPKYHLHGICGTTSAGDSNEIGIAENSQIIVTAMEIDRSSSTIGTVIDGVFNFTDIITQDLLTGYDLNAKMTTYGWDGLTRVNVKVVVAEDTYIIAPSVDKYAITVGSLPGGSSTKITIRGHVWGHGGAGAVPMHQSGPPQGYGPNWSVTPYDTREWNFLNNPNEPVTGGLYAYFGNYIGWKKELSTFDRGANKNSNGYFGPGHIGQSGGSAIYLGSSNITVEGQHKVKGGGGGGAATSGYPWNNSGIFGGGGQPFGLSANGDGVMPHSTSTPNPNFYWTGELSSGWHPPLFTSGTWYPESNGSWGGAGAYGASGLGPWWGGTATKDAPGIAGYWSGFGGISSGAGGTVGQVGGTGYNAGGMSGPGPAGIAYTKQSGIDYTINTDENTLITSVSGVPFQPTNLQTTNTNGNIRLFWNESDGAVTYKVTIGTDSLFANNPIIVAGITDVFYDHVVTNWIPYWYKVTAVNSIGDSIESSVVSSHGFNFTGGQEVEYTKNDIVWHGHTFVYDPNITNTFTIDNSWNVDMLLVGGGGGGAGFGGGGGAGGYAEITGVRLNPGTYSITIGQGGTSGTSDTNTGNTTQGNDGGITKIEGLLVTDTITGIHQLTPVVQLKMQNHDNVSTKNYYDGNHLTITNVVGTTELNNNSYYVKNVAQVVTTDTIDAVVQLTPGVQLTVNAHPFVDADPIVITGVVGTTELNDNTYYVKKIDANTIDLYTDVGLTTALDGTSFTAYTSGGTLTKTIPNRLELYTDDNFYFPVDGTSFTAYTSGGTTSMQISYEVLGGGGGGTTDNAQGSHSAEWDGKPGGQGGGGAGAPYYGNTPQTDTYPTNVTMGNGGISTQFSTYNYGSGYSGGKGYFPNSGGGGGGAGGAGEDAYITDNAVNGDPYINGSPTYYDEYHGGDGGPPGINDYATGIDKNYAHGGGGTGGLLIYDDVTVGGYTYFHDSTWAGLGDGQAGHGRGGRDLPERWYSSPYCANATAGAGPGDGGGGGYFPCSAASGASGTLVIRYAKPTGRTPATPTGLALVASDIYAGAMVATWTPVSGAEEYEIEFSKSAYMVGSKIIRITGQYTDTIPANLFDDMAWYFFKIRSRNIIGTSNWSGLSEPALVRPRGGDYEILYVQNNKTYYGHTFTTDGNFLCPFDITADIFMVGGGGGGGIARGGGGGAGGLVQETSYTIPTASHTVIAGAGGAGADPFLDENGIPQSSHQEENRWPQAEQQGGDSKLGTLLTAKGGGAGGNIFFDHQAVDNGGMFESAFQWVHPGPSAYIQPVTGYELGEGAPGGCGGGAAGGGRFQFSITHTETQAQAEAWNTYRYDGPWAYPPWRCDPGSSNQNSLLSYGTGYAGGKGYYTLKYSGHCGDGAPCYASYLKWDHYAEAAGGGGGVSSAGGEPYSSHDMAASAPYNGFVGHGGIGGNGTTNNYRDGSTRYYGGGGGGASGSLAPWRWPGNVYPTKAYPGTMHAWGGDGSEGVETVTYGAGHGGSVGNAVNIWGVAYRRTPGAGRAGSGSGGGGASSEPGRNLVTGYISEVGDNTMHGGAGGSGTVIIKYEVPAEPDPFTPSALAHLISDRGHYIIISWTQAYIGEAVDYYTLYKDVTINPTTVDQTITDPGGEDTPMSVEISGNPGDYVYFGISATNDQGAEGMITYFEHQFSTNFSLQQPATFTATEFTTTDGVGNTILGIRLDWSSVPFVTNYEITTHDGTTHMLNGSTTTSEVLLYQDFTAWYGDTFTYKIRSVDNVNSSFSLYKTVDITTGPEQQLTLTISTDVQNYNLQTEAVSAGWDLSKQGYLTVDVDQGVIVYSNNPTNPAIITGQDLAVYNWEKGTTITINNSGNIYGAAGASGAGSTYQGQPGDQGGEGGTGIYFNYSILEGSTLTVNNLSGGVIKGGGGGGGGGGAGNDTAGWGAWSGWNLSSESNASDTSTAYGFTYSINNYTTAHYGNMQDIDGHIRWNNTTLGYLTQWMNSNFQNNFGDFWERVCSASISQDGSQGWDGRSNYYSNTLDNSAYGSSGNGTGEFYGFTASQYQYQVDRNNTTSYSAGNGYDVWDPYRSIIRYAIRRRGATTVSAGTGGNGGSGMGHNIALTNGTTGTDGNDDTSNGNDQAGNGGTGGWHGFVGEPGTAGSGGALGGTGGIAGYIIEGNSGANTNINQITFNDTGSKVIGTQYNDTYVNTALGAWSGWGSDGIAGDSSVWWFAIHRGAFPVDGNGNIIHNSSVTNIGEILTQNVYGDTNLPASMVHLNPTGTIVTVNMQTIYPLMTLTYTSPFLINNVEYEFEAENGVIPGTSATFHTVPFGSGTRTYHYFKVRRRSNTSYT